MYADKRAACVLPFFSHPCCLPIAELASRERSEGAMNPNRSLDRPMGMGLSFFGFPKRFGMKWRRRSCCVFFLEQMDGLSQKKCTFVVSPHAEKSLCATCVTVGGMFIHTERRFLDVLVLTL